MTQHSCSTTTLRRASMVPIPRRSICWPSSAVSWRQVSRDAQSDLVRRLVLVAGHLAHGGRMPRDGTLTMRGKPTRSRRRPAGSRRTCSSSTASARIRPCVRRRHAIRACPDRAAAERAGCRQLRDALRGSRPAVRKFSISRWRSSWSWVFFEPNLCRSRPALCAGRPAPRRRFTLYTSHQSRCVLSSRCARVLASRWRGAIFRLAGIGMFFGWCVFVRRRLLFFRRVPTSCRNISARRRAPTHAASACSPARRERPDLSLRYRRRPLLLVARAARARRQCDVTVASLGMSLRHLLILTRCMRIESRASFCASADNGLRRILPAVRARGSALNQFAGATRSCPRRVFSIARSNAGVQRRVHSALCAAVRDALDWMNRPHRDIGTLAKFALGPHQVCAGSVSSWAHNSRTPQRRVPLVFCLLYLLHTPASCSCRPSGCRR